MSVLEAGMLICFGASWPFAIAKTVRTKTVHGKSRMFLGLILTGYGLGVLHKYYHNPDLVMFLYVFNFLMVLTEFILCFVYARSTEGTVLDDDEVVDEMFDDPVLLQEGRHR